MMPRIVSLGLVVLLAFSAAPTVADDGPTVPPPGCIWRGTAPLCEGECEIGEELFRRGNCGDGRCCVTGTKVLCCTPKSPAAAPAPAAAPCPSGYVWRESFEGDVVCVKPDERFRLENGTCRSGYVWRGLFTGDNICVTPADRAAAKAHQESEAKKPVKKLGKRLPGTSTTSTLPQKPGTAGGGGAEYATAITPATIYVEPGGAAFKDANGDDIGIPVGSKFLVLEKRTNPVWYKLQTKPVGWVWGEDVTLGP